MTGRVRSPARTTVLRSTKACRPTCVRPVISLFDGSAQGLAHRPPASRFRAIRRPRPARTTSAYLFDRFTA